MVVELPGYKALGIPIKLGRTPGSVRTAPRALGEDSREICRNAGLDEHEIDDLVARKVVLESL
jgi:crotonobetainyl-CoA:carnitine CoA-transferase CaiB-like acyl-CoA transferase